MKYNTIFKLAFSIVVGLGIQSCSQNETFVDQNNLEVINIYINDSGIQNSDPMSRATTTNYVTSFTAGDQIGLFAVRNGVVLNAINNVSVTYINSIDGWESLDYTDDLEGATYYAYYPYSNMNTLFDPSKSDPFEDMTNNWILDSNQSGDNYTKYDLMTGTATPLPSGRSFNLNFNFAHRMSLVAFQLPYANIKYEFTNEGIDDYIIAYNYSDEAFKVDNIEIIPFFDQESREYRFLTKPGVNVNLSGTFLFKENEAKSYTVTIVDPEARKYYNILVDGGNLGEKVISHTLKVGDRFYSDGTLQAENATTVTVENCIGIVAYVGNPMPSLLYPTDYSETQDVLLRDYPGCTHGVVLGLGEIRGSFGTRTGRLTNWFSDNGLSGLYIDTFGGTTSTINSDNAIAGNKILGYNNTRLIEMYNASSGLDDYSVAVPNLQQYRADHPTPTFTTNWYIPSVYELRILAQFDGDSYLTTCNQYLEKAGGTPFIVTRYWSSTESGAENQWTGNMTGGDPLAFAYYRTARHNTAFICRYCLAF